MKKLFLLLVPLFLMHTVDTAFAANIRTKSVMSRKNKNVLIAYFSWSGNTQYIAEKIHSRIG